MIWKLGLSRWVQIQELGYRVTDRVVESGSGLYDANYVNRVKVPERANDSLGSGL